MANEFIIKNGYRSQGNSGITGSLIVTGGITGSLFGTASWAENALTASYVNPLNQKVIITGSLLLTGSLDITGSINITSNTIISGSLKITGSSNHIGSTTQIGDYILTGSFNHSGSTTQIGDVTIIGNNTFSGSLFISGSSTDRITTNIPITSSQNISSSLDVIARTGSFDYIIDRGDAVIEGDLVVNGSVIFSGGLQFGGNFSSASLSANTNNLLITGLASSILVRISSTANVDLTGIVVPDNTKAYFFNIFNINPQAPAPGAYSITFKNQNAGSTAQNRFLLGADVNLQPGEGVTLIYDPVDLRWRSPGKNI